jgi:hypothetical protein
MKSLSLDATKLEFHQRMIDDRLDYYEQNRRNDESSVVYWLRLWAATRQLEKVINAPPVSEYRFECPVGGLKMDLRLDHENGSITIVEAKKGAANDMRAICAGIGQLFMYKAALRAEMRRELPPIRLVLVSDMDVEQRSIGIVMLACQMAGVEYFPVPSYQSYEDFIITRNQKWIKEEGWKRAFPLVD